MRLEKVQITLRIRADGSESPLDAFWMARVSKRGPYRLRSDCVAAQANLSVRWTTYVGGTFLDVAA